MCTYRLQECIDELSSFSRHMIREHQVALENALKSQIPINITSHTHTHTHAKIHAQTHTKMPIVTTSSSITMAF